jgi:hypothetical protein
LLPCRYQYPETPFRIFFYRHKVSGECTFEKPGKMRWIDDTQFRERWETLEYGCTLAQKAAITRVQALYRGYKIRSYYLYVEKAMEISEAAERMYMTHPEKDSSLYNYALHCHVILHDYDRARSLYVFCSVFFLFLLFVRDVSSLSFDLLLSVCIL